MIEVVLMSDPRVTALPVRDCGEELVDLRGCRALLIDGRRRDADGTFAWVRQDLRRRLEHAARLLPDGIRILAVEGYRPRELQLQYFQEYCSQLRALHPDWAEPQVLTAASRYVAPPEIAPHTAGAAIDLTLCAEDGKELDLGSTLNASPEESNGACYTDAPDLPPASRSNRAVLIQALRGVGLTNYPTEWWHWSVGDRYWAAVTGAVAAHYGPCSPPILLRKSVGPDQPMATEDLLAGDL
jgi:D-alanyl-D-alanine dipeptidase